jgi:hypothetical protein
MKRPKARPNPGLPRQGRAETSLLPCELHPSLVVPLLAAGPMTWGAHPRGGDGWVGDDVAPTSFNEGRGEVVVRALIVVFRLGLKHRLVDDHWWWYKQKGERAAAAQCGNVPNAERRKHAIFGKGAARRETGFPVVCSAESRTVVVPRTNRAAEEDGAYLM